MSHEKNRICIYLNDEVMHGLRTAARQEHLTMSCYISKLIEKKLKLDIKRNEYIDSFTPSEQMFFLLKEIKRSIVDVTHKENSIYRNSNYVSRLLTFGCEAKKTADGKTIIKPDEEIKRIARKNALNDYRNVFSADLTLEDYLIEPNNEEGMYETSDNGPTNSEISSQSFLSPDPVTSNSKEIDPNRHLNK